VPAKRSTASFKYQVSLPSANKQAYYRLKMIDNDGRYNYSNILNITSNCALKFGFVVTPNPVVGRTLTVNLYGAAAGTQVDIIIHNANGSIVSRATKVISEGSSSLTLPVDNLPTGTYFIKAVDVKNNNSFATKFVKQQ
jgi:hypothetical protein